MIALWVTLVMPVSALGYDVQTEAIAKDSESDAGAASAVERLRIFFSNTRWIYADFQQSLVDSKGSKVQEASGTLVMQRPGKFRWSYLKPHRQLIIADGNEITIYDEDLQQATIKPMAGLIGSTPASLLSGTQPLDANFDIEEAVPKAGLVWVELTPKQKDSGFERIRLGFNRSDLQAMEMEDSFGQTTYLRFTNMKHNIKPASGVFIFTPPVGTDVVREVGQ